MDRMNVSEYRKFLLQKPKKNGKEKNKAVLRNGLLVEEKKEPKYHNKKCVYEGITFDSEKERDRYIFLLSCQRSGLISDLRLQVRFVLFPDEYDDVVKHLKTKDKIIRRRCYEGTDYVADFVYNRRGVMVYEDVKGAKETLTKEFRLKMKILHYVHGIDLRLVYNPTEAV